MNSALATASAADEAVGQPAPLTLIVLTNFFPAAYQAVRYAAELAAPIGARLVLLHVRAASALEGELLLRPPKHEGDLRAAVLAIAHGVAVPVAVELVPDLQLSTALGLARRFGPVLFVLGRAEAPARNDDVSTAVQNLLRGGGFPLLVVPEAYHGPCSPTRIAVAADGEPFGLDQATFAFQLVARLRPVITVVTVDSIEDDQACAAALRYVKASGLTAGASYTTPLAVRHPSPAQGLLTAIAQTEAQLLVLIARHRSFFGAMFHRSVTSQLLAESPVPLLVQPATDG